MGPMWSHRVPSWLTGPWCSSVQWSLATLLAALPRLAPSPSATVPSDTSLKSGQGQWKHTNSLWRFGENGQKTLCNWLRSCELKQLNACVTTVMDLKFTFEVEPCPTETLSLRSWTTRPSSTSCSLCWLLPMHSLMWVNTCVTPTSASVETSTLGTSVNCQRYLPCMGFHIVLRTWKGGERNRRDSADQSASWGSVGSVWFGGAFYQCGLRLPPPGEFPSGAREVGDIESKLTIFSGFIFNIILSTDVYIYSLVFKLISLWRRSGVE